MPEINFDVYFSDADQSISSDLSFADADDSNTSTFTITDAETSTTVADDFNILETTKTEEVKEEEDSSNLLEAEAQEAEIEVSPEPIEVIPETIAEEPLDIKEEIKIEELEPEPEIDAPVENLCNLEQQMSDFALSEQQDETSLVNEAVSDVEMKEEPENDVEQAPVESTENPEEPLVQDVIDEVEVKKEELPTEVPDQALEAMEIDDAKFVRRSRRLQSIYIDPPPLIKAEEIAPVPPPEEMLADPSLPAIEVKTETITEPITIDVPPPKPTFNTEIRVPHTDERLKRYETIRDNIYLKKSDKKVCKVNKTMKCDCTITEDEVKSGEVGCQYNCINRILYIECGMKCRCGGELKSNLESTILYNFSSSRIL
jgi:hypothetical protein